MADQPLKGTAVIVTRPAHQAEPLCRAVERAGGRPIRYPTLEILPPKAPSLARSRLATLQPGDWAIFISTNAVDAGLRYFPDGRLPRGVKAAAVGPATAEALQRAGVEDVLVPERHDSEGLLGHPELESLAGRRVALLKAPGGRRVLARGLRHHGAEVLSVLVYRRGRPSVTPGEFAARLPDADAIVTTVTSGEVLDNLVHMVEADTLARLKRSPMVAAGERVAGLARWAGFERVVAARGPDPDSLVEAMVRNR